MTSEARRVLTAGLALVAIYAALAAWSGSLTPLARGPLLDGIAPIDYRWVAPPPELESTNQEPSSGAFGLSLGDRGVGTEVVFTSDSQVTVVVDEGSFGPAPKQRSVELVVEPVDPAELAALGNGLAAFGNAYRFGATYRPSGDAVDALDEPLQVILVYPSTSSLHATTHDILYSPDGERWEPLDTTDSPAQQQAQTDLPGLGYVVVAGVPSPVSPSPGGAGSGGGVPAIAVALLVAAGVVFVIGLGLLIRSRGG